MPANLTNRGTNRAMLALAAALALFVCLIAPDIPSALLKAPSKRSAGSAFSSATSQKTVRAEAKDQPVAILPVLLIDAPSHTASPLEVHRSPAQASVALHAHGGRSPPVSLV